MIDPHLSTSTLWHAGFAVSLSDLTYSKELVASVGASIQQNLLYRYELQLHMQHDTVMLPI